MEHTPAFRRTPVVTAVPSGLLTQQVYVPRSSSFTTRMVSSWKFFRVEEMRRWPLLSRRTPSLLQVAWAVGWANTWQASVTDWPRTTASSESSLRKDGAEWE